MPQTAKADQRHLAEEIKSTESTVVEKETQFGIRIESERLDSEEIDFYRSSNNGPDSLADEEQKLCSSAKVSLRCKESLGNLEALQNQGTLDS